MRFRVPNLNPVSCEHCFEEMNSCSMVDMCCVLRSDARQVGQTKTAANLTRELLRRSQPSVVGSRNPHGRQIATSLFPPLHPARNMAAFGPLWRTYGTAQ